MRLPPDAVGLPGHSPEKIWQILRLACDLSRMKGYGRRGEESKLAALLKGAGSVTGGRVTPVRGATPTPGE